MSDDQITLRKESVQETDPPVLEGGFADGWSFYMQLPAHIILPRWGTPERDAALRGMWYKLHNTLVIGAHTNLITRIKQIPYELVSTGGKSSGRNLVRRYSEMLQNAQYGEGWDYFTDLFLQDYLGQDNGAFIELIGRGNADTPLRGGVMGVAVLDSLRCYATGNPEFPVFYRSHRTGKLHKIHHSRVVRCVAHPSPDPYNKGRGLSSLSRSAAISSIQMLMSKYNVEKLNDLPPAGIMSLSGLTETQFKQAMLQYEAGNQSAGNAIFRNVMRVFGTDPKEPIKFDFLNFSELPESFDFRSFMEVDVNLLALAMGEDPTEIWTLSGQRLGTSGQSTILHLKGKSKIQGHILRLLERVFNIRILPREIELRYKENDTQQSETEARTGKIWADLASQLKRDGVMDEKEARRLLSNTVAAFADVLLDENGNLRLPDVDPKPEGDEVPQVETNVSNAQTQETNTQDANPVIVEDTETKSLQSTRLDFENDFEDLLIDAAAGRLNRSRFGIILRSQIAKYGRRAYEDGLKEGGVLAKDMTEEDYSKVDRLVVAQSAYVSGLGKVLFKEDGVTPEQLTAKPAMWFNKSIQPFWEAGLMSADRNGLYEWVYGDTEHCTDCQRLNGQIHRLKNWIKSGWKPKASKLKCKGFNCKCQWIKRTGVEVRGGY